MDARRRRITHRARWLIAAQGVDPVRWARRWGIEPFTFPCSQCERDLTTSIPFAVGALRGLVAPRCACGNYLTPYAVVRDPRAGDLLIGRD